ncbi:MAG: hypothetical protein UHN47_06920 [Lachnospiraceae bacterium]|nr:hypothetical protein [Lachnospiraceae bacterium]
MRLERTEYDDYDVPSEKYQKYHIPICVGIVTVIIITGIICLYKWSNAKTTEAVVERYLQTYGSGMDQAELTEITRNITTKLDASLESMNTKELSQENMQQLLDEVMYELSTTTYSIPESEINKIAAQVVSKVIEMNAVNNEAKMAEYATMIESLSNRMETVEAISNNMVTTNEIENIIQKNTMTKEEITTMMQDQYSMDVVMQKLSQNLNISTDDLYSLIAKNRSYTDEVYSKLSDTLGMNKEDIKNLFKEQSDLKATITLLAGNSKVSEDEIRKVIAEATALTDEEIKRLEEELNKKDGELQAIVNTAKEELTASQIELEEHLTQEIQDNYATIEKANAIKKAMEEANVSIQTALNVEQNLREEAVNKAIQKIEEAIQQADNADEQQKEELEKAKSMLQEALTESAEEQSDALKAAEASINASIVAKAEEINTLNNTVTSISSSVANNAQDIELLEDEVDMKAEITYSVQDGVPVLTIENVIKD